VVPERRLPILNKTSLFHISLTLFTLLLFSCEEEIKTDYQSFMDKDYPSALLVLNGEAETISAYSAEDDKVFKNLQLVGHNGSSEAWPADMVQSGDSVYVICSGQNSIEKYSAETLDYEGEIYLKNGFNPMALCLLGDGTKAAVSGYVSDEIVLVDLAGMTKLSGFIPAFEEVAITNSELEENSEIKKNPIEKNAVGDNKKRGTTGLAVSGTVLYAGNVRYDSSILLTDSNGALITYEGSDARAAGYFREGTISIFQISDDYASATLTREINLQDQFEGRGGEAYFPGNGLNPQSLFVLEGKLHIVCTGTNGGSARTYTSGEYIPTGYSEGDIVPGTDPDDGVILIMDLTDPLNPNLEKILNIGGSPSGFRDSADKAGKVLYLAGVGGIQSYNYASETVLRGSDNTILAGDNPSADFYSHVLYDSDRLFVSDYTHDKLNILIISDNGTDYSYELAESRTIGDGPGALSILTR
jgi:hypothetical protein